MKCILTNEDMVTCPHCNDDNYLMVDAPGPEYETIGRAFKSQFKGTCTIEYRHDIRKGDLVSKVQRSDNPSLVITGVACRNCTIMLPRGKR